MDKKIRNITRLFHTHYDQNPDKIEKLPVSGSSRTYYRLYINDQSIIGVFHANAEENKAFVSFTRHFINNNLPVPGLIREDLENQVYLIEDLGNTTLYKLMIDRSNNDNLPPSLWDYYKKSLADLLRFQTVTHEGLDYSLCYPSSLFDKESMMWDLNYFKYCFLKPAYISFHEKKLEDEFNRLVEFLDKADKNFFMYRDFQARNIMIVHNKPFFIDYQGGKTGPSQYDVASLLYQARTNISEENRNLLLHYYLEEYTKKSYSTHDFLKYYHGFVVLRILQTLGTYGFRGLLEKKPHFLNSLSLALHNLKDILNNKEIGIDLPHLKTIIEQAYHTYNPKETTVPEILTIHIGSFSYKKGLPHDKSSHGGGFVFDCRALPNPGRFEKYQSLTGKDKEVIHFLEKEKEVAAFVDHVWSLVSQSVNNYLERDFSYLSVYFGCTGGQHRSVYMAEKFSGELQKKFPVQIITKHRELE